MIAAVFSLSAASIACTSGRNDSLSLGIDTILAPVCSINTLYSGKYGAITSTSSSADTIALRAQVSAAAAPTVMYRSSLDTSKPCVSEIYFAIAALTLGSPAADVYPWSLVGSMLLMRFVITSFTSSGHGTLGLPSEKSKTFSSPISALRLIPYSKSSLISDLSEPNLSIFSFIIFPPRQKNNSELTVLTDATILYTFFKKSQ